MTSETRQEAGTPESSTLANVNAGQDTRVTRILFGALRALCEDLGIRENERFHCRSATGTMLVLEAEDGHIVSLAKDWAKFIRVETMGMDGVR